MITERVIDELNKKLSGKIKNLFRKNDRRLYVDIDKKDIVESARILYQEFKARFSIATGLDTFKGIEILYHFSLDRQGGIFISLRVLIEDKNNPEIESLSGLFKASEWIEREIYEMLGVNFKGHPELKRLLLADDWPEGKYPLRKDFVSEKGLPENE